MSAINNEFEPLPDDVAGLDPSAAFVPLVVFVPFAAPDDPLGEPPPATDPPEPE
jgi:hypothetical protein